MNQVEVTHPLPEEGITSFAEVKIVFGSTIGFFNNFLFWFPTSREESLVNRRGLIKAAGQEDIPFAQVERGKEGVFSPKFLQTTPRQFFETIDRLALERGVSFEEVKRLKNQEASARDLNERCLIRDELDELISPIFFKLREMGYGYLELTM